MQGKAVIVVGGGDTGTDCIGTSVRHGAKQARSYTLPFVLQARSYNNNLAMLGSKSHNGQVSVMMVPAFLFGPVSHSCHVEALAPEVSCCCGR